MNANELADELERFESFNGDVFFGTCAVMLRQQQAEIEALKVSNQALKILNDGNNKIIAEYECKYPDFFFMEHDIQGKR